MTPILQKEHLFRPQVRAAYLSCSSNDLGAVSDFEANVLRLGNVHQYIESLDEWKILQRLKALDRKGVISLEYIDLRPGSHAVKQAIVENRSNITEVDFLPKS